MNRLRRLLERARPAFSERGRWYRLRPVFDAFDSTVAGSASITGGAPHVRDAISLRRVMAIVFLALVPCSLVGMWNVGHQAHLALAGAAPAGWRGTLLSSLGLATGGWFGNLAFGALHLAPAVLVCFAAVLFWEGLFGIVRGRAIAEGLWVTALLFPLTLPPAVPLWQVGLGASFGIIVAREMFGGLGRNFVHPVLVARAFLYFSYPTDHAGNAVWVAVDGWSGATPLTAVSMGDVATGMRAAGYSWTDAFLGTLPGCVGETSALACLLGGLLLAATGLASWRVMVSMLAGAALTALFFNAVGSPTNPMFPMPPHWHVVTGGFAFGMVFLATDPVTSAQTDAGRWIYGFLVGLFVVVVRVLNPGYSESVMIVLILGNVFAPLIDWFVIQANVRRRRLRLAGD